MTKEPLSKVPLLKEKLEKLRTLNDRIKREYDDKCLQELWAVRKEVIPQINDLLRQVKIERTWGYTLTQFRVKPSWPDPRRFNQTNR